MIENSENQQQNLSQNKNSVDEVKLISSFENNCEINDIQLEMVNINELKKQVSDWEKKKNDVEKKTIEAEKKLERMQGKLLDFTEQVKRMSSKRNYYIKEINT